MYERYADPRWLDPDPLPVVRRYDDPADVELAGLAAAALALGSATLIVRAAEAALAPLGPRPASALAAMDDDGLATRITSYNVCYTKLLRAMTGSSRPTA